MDWVNANTAEAAELIGGYDIVDATVAEKALPYCNIVCVTGTEMKDMLSGYLQVLWDAGRSLRGRRYAQRRLLLRRVTADKFSAPRNTRARWFPGERGRQMKRRTGSVRLWAVAFWLLVWQGASLALAATTGGRMLLLASPVQALGRLLALAGTAAFWQAVAFSALRILGGFAPGLRAGGGAGTAGGPFPWIRDLLSPLVAAVKAVPVVSFIILALICLLVGDLSLLISALMVFPPMYLQRAGGHRAHGPAAAGDGPGVPGALVRRQLWGI